MKREVNWIKVNVVYTRKTAKSFLLRMCVDGNEVWFPKSTCGNVMEGSNQIQSVEIMDWMLKQKGYGDIMGKQNVVTELQSKCIVCGALLDNPSYKYCRNCYGQRKEQGREKEYPKSEFQEYVCEKCGFSIRIQEGEYSKITKCEKCGWLIFKEKKKSGEVVIEMKEQKSMDEYYRILCDLCEILNEGNKYGGVIPIFEIWNQFKKSLRLSITQEEFNYVLLELEKQRKIDLSIANDRSTVRFPESGIDISNRGLIYYVSIREPIRSESVVYIGKLSNIKSENMVEGTRPQHLYYKDFCTQCKKETEHVSSNDGVSVCYECGHRKVVISGEISLKRPTDFFGYCGKCGKIYIWEQGLKCEKCGGDVLKQLKGQYLKIIDTLIMYCKNCKKESKVAKLNNGIIICTECFYKLEGIGGM